ncbi:hypothetical protein BC940DRAFT_367930 [Gongronella butleri]|nr:hypothetical protein BC940DRAFT_367930 [Gongronella butleri]
MATIVYRFSVDAYDLDGTTSSQFTLSLCTRQTQPSFNQLTQRLQERLKGNVADYAYFLEARDGSRWQLRNDATVRHGLTHFSKLELIVIHKMRMTTFVKPKVKRWLPAMLSNVGKCRVAPIVDVPKMVDAVKEEAAGAAAATIATIATQQPDDMGDRLVHGTNGSDNGNDDDDMMDDVVPASDAWAARKDSGISWGTKDENDKNDEMDEDDEMDEIDDDEHDELAMHGSEPPPISASSSSSTSTSTSTAASSFSSYSSNLALTSLPPPPHPSVWHPHQQQLHHGPPAHPMMYLPPSPPPSMSSSPMSISGSLSSSTSTNDEYAGQCHRWRAKQAQMYTCVHPKKDGGVCGQTFQRPYDLTRHQTMHMKNRPYVYCQVCTKRFTRLDALRRHERVQGHALQQTLAPSSLPPPNSSSLQTRHPAALPSPLYQDAAFPSPVKYPHNLVPWHH